jgi:vancomycin permeability regulator SanA
VRRPPRRMILVAIGALAVTGILALGVVHVATYALVGKLVFERPSDLPPGDVVVVLASGARPRGPSDAAVERLNTALELLRSGYSDKVLLSGQSFEVEAMRRFLTDRGVAAAAITMDGESERTFDTCDRLKNVYGLGPVVLVSQAEHVARAVFTCRELGVPAVGLVAPAFDGAAFWVYRAHELAALPLAWWEIYARPR